MADERYPSQLAERFQIRLPDGLRDSIKASAESNRRSMNSEIVARLLASFGEAAPTEKPTMTAPMDDIRTARGNEQIMLRVPDGMRDTVKARAAANGRSLNAELVAIIAAALSGDDDRLSRIEAKLDQLLNIPATDRSA
jgi:plasmid stability protein